MYPYRILIGINRIGIIESKIAKESNINYGLVTDYINLFVRNNIATKERDGRCAYITLTDKGRDLQNYILQILNILKDENLGVKE